METAAYVALAGAILSSVGVVAARRPVRSALSLLAFFLTLGVAFVALGAVFLGIAQVLVYAGAIVTFFLLVVMLLGSGLSPLFDKGARALLSVVATVALAGLTVVSALLTPLPDVTARARGSAEALVPSLFNELLVPFEVASLLLLVALVAALTLTRRKR